MSRVAEVADEGRPQSDGPPGAMWSRVGPRLAAYGSLQLALDWIRVPAAAPALAVDAATLVASAAVIALAALSIVALTRPMPGWRSLAQIAAAGFAAWILAIGARVWMGEWLTNRDAAGQELPLGFRLLASGAGTAGDLGVLCLGAGIGCAVARLIRDRNILLPAGIFAAFADFFMVRYGTVHHAMQTEAGQRVIAAMSAQVPALHASLTAVTLGMADFLFLAFFFACASRFRMEFRATYLALTAVLSLLLFGVRWLGAVPAVAPMAIAFLAVNARHFRLSRSEMHATGVVFLLMAGLAGAFLFLQR